MAATLDLSKLSLQELQDLPTSDGPKPTQPAQIDTGLSPNHNVVDMFDGSDIKQPDQTGSMSQDEISKAAQYRAQQAAYSLQQAGTPLNREQYKRLVLDQYDQVFKLNVPRTPEELAKLQQEQLNVKKTAQETGDSPQKAKQLDASQAIELSAASSSFDSLDQMQKEHAANVDAKEPGFGTPLKGQAPGAADWTPKGAAYVALSEGSLPLFAKGISNVVGNPSESDMKSVRAMALNPGDSKATVAEKVRLFRDKILIAQKAKLEALKGAGYDVSAMETQYNNLVGKVAGLKQEPTQQDKEKTDAYTKAQAEKANQFAKVTPLPPNPVATSTSTPTPTPTPTPTSTPTPTPTSTPAQPLLAPNQPQEQPLYGL